MPANIRATTEFNAGGLVLQSHTTRVAEDGFVEAKMNFACLASALRNNLQRFRMEAIPPVPLPQDVASLPLETNNIYLNAIDSTADKGIGYIQASYVGCSLDQKRNIAITESQRSFSGQATASFRVTTPGLLGTSTGTFTFTQTFDYTAESFSVVWSEINRRPEPELKPVIKNFRNFSNDAIASRNVTLSLGRAYRMELIRSLSIVPVGPVKRYSMTVSAEAVQRN